MKQSDLFLPIIRNNVAPRFVPAFSRNILRPNNNFATPREPAQPRDGMPVGQGC